jgi:transcriptional regulator with XRE-family HTH domain
MTSERAAIGRRIRNRRETLELSQYDLHRETGLRIESLSRIENGHCYPSVTALVRLCQAMDTSARELLGV